MLETIAKHFIGLNKFIEVCQEPLSPRKIVCDPTNINKQAKSNSKANWYDLSFMDGYPAFVLFFTVLDELGYQQQRFDLVTHQYVLEIKNSLEEGDCFLDVSLFSGLAGLCYTLSVASKNRTRYAKMLEVLEELLLQRVEQVDIPQLQQQLNKKNPINFRLYDVISGFTGVGLYLLKNNLSKKTKQIVVKLVELAVDITLPISYQNYVIPGWFCPPEFYPQKEAQKQHPSGIFNMGLSHGVPSLLGFMAVALQAGVEVAGQKKAMKRIMDWLKAHVTPYENGSFFRAQISFEEQVNLLPPKPPSSFNREAWCYGTPGVARTLYLAGEALGEKDLVQFAEEVFLSIFRRSYENWNLAGPTFCHGLSGTLLITYLMAKDTQNPFLLAKVQEMTIQLQNFYNPSYPFGFRDFDLCEDKSYYPLDKASLLTGAIGTWLTWLTTQSKTIPDWYYPFMVSYA